MFKGLKDRLKRAARSWLSAPEAQAVPGQATAEEDQKRRQRMRIRTSAMLAAIEESQAQAAAKKRSDHPMRVMPLPPGFPVQARKAKLAMDSAYLPLTNWAIGNNAFTEGMQFLGYAYLSELAQRAEYRRPAEILAKEMTRKWIKIQATGKEGAKEKAERINQIEAEFKRLRVRKAFREALEHDGFFGRSHIFIDVGGSSDQPEELKLPLAISGHKIGKGALKRLKVVEPMWCYPNDYNSIDPLSEHFYKPLSWFCLSKEVHASRLLTIVSREVPDMLKPAYAFGGLSLSQMAKPYVDNWLRTRQSVSDLVHSFSASGLSTDLSSLLQEGGEGGGWDQDTLLGRLRIFNTFRDNNGTLLLDKETEEWFNMNTPLGTLDALQAQSQEHMAAVTGIPLVKLLGITPTGLNASSDGEIRSFYDWVEAQQEGVMRDPLTKVLQMVQLNMDGVIDPDITFAFVPLFTMTPEQVATIRKTDAEADQIRINEGVIDTVEARTRLATEEDSPYSSLDLSVIPVPAESDDGGPDDGLDVPTGFPPGPQPPGPPALNA